MHDTPAGFRVDMTDLTTRPARLDDRLDRQRVRPHPVHAELQHLPGGAVRVPPGVLDRRTRAGTPGRRTPQRGHVGRDRPLRELPGASTRTSTAPRRARQDPSLDADDDRLLRAGNRLDAGADQRVLRRRRGLRRAVLSQRLAGHEPERRSWTGCCTRRRCCSPARPTQRTELLDRRLRDRPAADRGVGLAVQPAVLRPDDRRELREPADRGAVLPVLLHDGHGTARAPGRRAANFIPAPRTTSAAVPPPSSGRCCRPSTRRPGFTTESLYNNFNSGDMAQPLPGRGKGPS